MKHVAVAVMISMLVSGCGLSRGGRGVVGGGAAIAGAVLIASSQSECDEDFFHSDGTCTLNNGAGKVLGATAIIVGAGLLLMAIGDDGEPTAPAPAPSRSNAPATSALTFR